MANPDIKTKEISTLTNPLHYISQQPIDRHLIEITDKKKSTFINAGIDSTCGRKRASIIHKFIDGTIVSSSIDSPTSIPVDNMIDSLTLDNSIELKTDEQSSTSVSGLDIPIPDCCTHCGK